MKLTEKKYVFKKVMVIEDNPTDSYIASFNIKKNGLAKEVVVMETAMEALKYLRESVENPDSLPELIFLDIKMPGQNGFEFLEEYEKLPGNLQNKRIIMMLTSSLNEEDRSKAGDNKFVCRFLNKPLDKQKIESLKHLLKQQLSPRQDKINYILRLDPNRSGQELELLSDEELVLLKVKVQYEHERHHINPFRKAYIPRSRGKRY